jgi:diguanylate cyclase (GGDEF)-like protein/PAS domain S-box-containing protein
VEHFTKSELITIVEKNIEEKESLELLLKSMNAVSRQYSFDDEVFTYVSKNSAQIVGYEVEEFKDLLSWKKMIHEYDREWVVEHYQSRLEECENYFLEYRMVKKNAEVIWVLDVVTFQRDKLSDPQSFSALLIDVTHKKLQQEKIKKEHAFLQKVLNGIADPVMIINDDYTVEVMNETVKKSLQGKKFIDPNSPKCYEVSHSRDMPCDGVDDPCPLKDVLASGKATTVLHNHRHADGSDHYVELAASPFFDNENNCVGIIESARNVTSHVVLRKELEKKSRQLEYEATHDYLTGLPNRALFMASMKQSIKDVQRDQTGLALLFMDLDHFKEVNDTFGHKMGDRVLEVVAEKFQACTRQNDILSRLSGDEFTVILKKIVDKEDIAHVAQKFIDVFKDGLLVDGHLLKLTVSIGISHYRYSSMHKYDEAFQEKLLLEADSAMYDAKDNGKSNFQFAT